MAAKLFTTLVLLGAIAVLVTGVLGYFRAQNALEKAVFDQLTAARQTKTRQVETYFRTIQADLRLLATSKMVVDATREFRIAVDQLDRAGVPPELQKKVGDWYAANFIPQMTRILGREPALSDYLPVGGAPYHLQYHYIVENPNPAERRKLLDDAGDRSDYSRLHAVYHPLMRAAATTVGFFDFMIADPKSGRLIYTVQKEVDFTTSFQFGPYRRSNAAAVVARCAESADRSAVCLEDFAPYAPSGGAPIAFMGAPVIDQGIVIGVLIAQLSNEEIDDVVTGGRRWRQEGFGDTGEAYLVGPDHLVRSGPRAFYENRDGYFAELKSVGADDEELDAIQRHGTPVLHQRIDTKATQAALAGVEGTGEIIGYRGVPTLASWGPLAIPGVKWALVAKIDSAEAFAPIARLRQDLLLVGGLALLVVAATAAWLSRALLGPLRELTAGVKRFAAGDYGASVPVRTRDEIGQLCAAFNGMVEELREKNVVIENKNRENEDLLLNVLPAPIANRLRGGEDKIADGFAEVTVAFADLVGFTALTSEMPPQEVVTFLNGLFTRFDTAANDLGIEKIKTVGDAYMAVCGLPVPVANHAERMVRMAIRMVHITREHAMEHNVPMKLRVGVNSGPVVAGVIGKSKYIYDLWGDTVNLASRMESGSIPDAVQVTRAVYERLKDQFVFEPRGAIEVKGKGKVEAWLLRL
ncbi:adenylate/guanylate cyclase domain-containing protein [Mesorhizobium sp.]|uniref:adenylate/guanylate cyclase domain-containing protein n=1 Tax=Mesorhizobium sp. TaxID=1871066 RepID=UPI000FE93B76|nr:adenylate/guanylate cyclase domain-containing protein [Mesorhizobium sp.]RWO21863.1 MAG: HAMP domain-containing protein [Mesorhizobium sp.]TIL28839.1 MAG: HAMP domain-containing protein [Mesorhizobium sp.]TIL44764.1 MAG: HAMP domain-containing protein [Mesorhizobium sp.]TIL95435.1 MAG: HAMP domain-containing protein [Mesorhizobium sp.]TIN36164.1 MAG: HAMP domain-containing protein [Mesorhizobium sp.]